MRELVEVIERVLEEHQGSAAEFCRGCHMIPAQADLDTWDTVGIRRHQAEKVAEAVLAHLRAVAADEGVRERVAIDALRRLVQLKDGPRNNDYYMGKHAAWDAARQALDHLDHLDTEPTA